MPTIQRADVIKASMKFEELCKRHHNLFSRKNEQYANTIVTTGVLGASVELIGAVMRLQPLVLHDRGITKEFMVELRTIRSEMEGRSKVNKDLVARIDELLNKYTGNACHGAHNVKELKDIFADIHNYANIALMMLEDENWDGIL